MKTVARAMKEKMDSFNLKKVELAKMVKKGLLSADDAALSLAGFDLKQHEALEEKGFKTAQYNHEGRLKYCRLCIDQLLPHYDGLIVGRHI